MADDRLEFYCDYLGMFTITPDASGTPLTFSDDNKTFKFCLRSDDLPKNKTFEEQKKDVAKTGLDYDITEETDIVTDKETGKKEEVDVLWFEFNTEDVDNIKHTFDGFSLVKTPEGTKYYYNIEDDNELSEKLFYESVKMVYGDLSNLLDKDNEFHEMTYTHLKERFEPVWTDIHRMSFKDFLGLPTDDLRTKVASNINIGEMIENLGYEKVDVFGKEVERRVYLNDDGDYNTKTKNLVYELLEVKTSDLVENSFQEVTNYAVKVWCDSTDKAHYIWVEDEYSEDALTAVASTFRIPKDDGFYDSIDIMQRQGDVMYYQYKDGVNKNKYDWSEDNLRPLTGKEYLGKLVAET